MSAMLRDGLTLTLLTLKETLRKRILLALLVGGGAFLVLFGIGFHFIVRDVDRHAPITLIERRMVLTFITLAGLYAVNFLSVMSAVLLPVDTLSGEIASGVLQTVAAKPVRRSSIVLGKWLAFALVLTAYLAAMAGGVLLIARLRGDLALPSVAVGVPLMWLEGLLLMTVSIAGGTRLSTVTNGILAFALFGLAFVGGWVEQIGTFAHNTAARDVGIVASLIMPSEALWQLAAHHMQPKMMSELALTPFSPASVPSGAMVWWAAGYVVLALALALRAFARRPL
jgi:ABC-type transport system involved in multi-copper enzyme maturation permease subunit